MRRLGTLIFLGLFATTALSCQEAAAPGPAAPITALPGVLATGICQGYEKCGGLEIVEFQKDCVPRLTARFEASFAPVVEAGRSAGTITYNADFLQACSGALANCGLTNQMPEACRSLVNGLVADGGACTSDLECKYGSRCVPGAGDICPGECRPWAAEGADCTDDGDCEEGFKCADAGTCEPPLAEGAACEDNEECDFYLVCLDKDGAGSAGTTCEQTVPLENAGLDDECGATSSPPAAPLCQPTLSCTNVEGGAVCVASSAAGASCLPGLPDPCPKAQYCDAPTCAPLPQAGEACVTYSLVLEKQCAAEFFCDDTTTCQPLVANGEACDEAKYDGADCLSGDCRDGKCDGAYVCDLPPG